jgi:hypothetical protein
VISMSDADEIKIVKSPFVTRKKVLPYPNLSHMIISVKLSNGVLITEPGQFASSEDTHE